MLVTDCCGMQRTFVGRIGFGFRKSAGAQSAGFFRDLFFSSFVFG